MTFIVRMLAVTALAGLIPGSAVAQGLAQTSESMATTSSLTIHHERAAQLLGTTTAASTVDAPGTVTYRILSQEELAAKIAAAGFVPPGGNAPFVIFRPSEGSQASYALVQPQAQDAVRADSGHANSGPSHAQMIGEGRVLATRDGRVQAIDIGGAAGPAEQFTNRLSLAMSNVDAEQRQAAYARVMNLAAMGWPLDGRSGMQGANLFTAKKDGDRVELVLEAVYASAEDAQRGAEALQKAKANAEGTVERLPAVQKNSDLKPQMLKAVQGFREGTVTVDGNRVVHQWVLPPEAMGAFLVAAGVK